MQPAYLGIEIGGTKLQLVTGDGQGNIHERRRLMAESQAGGEGIRQQIQAHLPALIANAKPRAIGVGFGGPVDWRTGLICCSHQVKGWSDFPLGQWLRDLSGLPVHVDNDANVGTLGEATRGAGREANPVLYCTLGSGVGGGLVVEGRIFHGAKPGEVELGHLLLDRDGTIVEERCSGWAVDRRIRGLRETDPDSLLVQRCAGQTGGEAKHLVAAVQAGDPAAKRLLAEVAEDLAFGLSHVTHLLHPEIITLGGGLGLMGATLADAVAAALPRFVMSAFAPGPRVVAAALGEDAIPVGALVLAASPTP